MARISHPKPRPDERRASIVLREDDAHWLDGVLADARRGGALGVGTSAVVRLALGRLRGEATEKIVAELIQARERGAD